MTNGQSRVNDIHVICHIRGRAKGGRAYHPLTHTTHPFIHAFIPFRIYESTTTTPRTQSSSHLSPCLCLCLCLCPCPCPCSSLPFLPLPSPPSRPHRCAHDWCPCHGGTFEYGAANTMQMQVYPKAIDQWRGRYIVVHAPLTEEVTGAQGQQQQQQQQLCHVPLEWLLQCGVPDCCELLRCVVSMCVVEPGSLSHAPTRRPIVDQPSLLACIDAHGDDDSIPLLYTRSGEPARQTLDASESSRTPHSR